MYGKNSSSRHVTKMGADYAVVGPNTLSVTCLQGGSKYAGGGGGGVIRCDTGTVGVAGYLRSTYARRCTSLCLSLSSHYV